MNIWTIAKKNIENRSRKAMNNNQVGTYKLVASPFHLDVRGKLSMGVLGKHLLNCADAYAAERGFDVLEQGGEHYTWVLSRLVIELEDLPSCHESFSIQTWVENVYRLFADRNFVIWDKDEKPIGYVRSVWAMISMETRNPANLLALYGDRITNSICEKECPIAKPGRIKVSQQAAVSEYIAKYSDLDINGHVNSIKYFEHILDIFPLDTYKKKALKRFEIAYVAESYYGDVLCFYMEEKNENEYDIEIKKNNQEVVVRSKVIFK